MEIVGHHHNDAIVAEFWNRVGKEQMAKGSGVSVRTKEIKKFQEGISALNNVEETTETHLEKLNRILPMSIHCMDDDEFDFYMEYK